LTGRTAPRTVIGIAPVRNTLFGGIRDIPQKVSVFFSVRSVRPILSALPLCVAPFSHRFRTVVAEAQLWTKWVRNRTASVRPDLSKKSR
jgi:hypothetical protein